LTGAVAHAQEAALAGRAGIVAPGTSEAFGGEAALAVLAAINDVLETLALSRFCDASPVEVFAGLGVVDDIGKRGGGDLALAATGVGCAGAGVEVAGGIDGLVGVRVGVWVMWSVRGRALMLILGSCSRGLMKVRWRRGGRSTVEAERW
jgi:hypothetical protein